MHACEVVLSPNRINELIFYENRFNGDIPRRVHIQEHNFVTLLLLFTRILSFDDPRLAKEVNFQILWSDFSHTQIGYHDY